jgi:hypothetical protein
MEDDRASLDLIDSPSETLTNEVKSHLDMDGELHRAKLARHICALANHGGGYIVFGFDDALKPRPLTGDIDKAFHRDRISSVVAAYLEPAVLCDTVIVTSSAGHRHPIIRVPSHGSVPICAKANGPQQGGKVHGITAGRHYIREVGTNGPESAPITRPNQWTALLRRCVAAERTAFVGLIEGFFDPKPTHLAGDTLEAWHDAASSKYRSIVVREQLPWSTTLEKNFYQLSYDFDGVDGGDIAGSSMIDILRQANAEMRDLVWTGWSMFYPFNDPKLIYFESDAYPGQSVTEVIEGNLLGAERTTSTLPDFWRVAANGKATIVRAYREDRSGYRYGGGTTWSPFMAARDLTEFLRHARAMATQFNDVQSVRFRCEWHGLKQRQLRDQESDWSIERVAKTDRVISTTERAVQDLTVSWAAIVSALVSRVGRAFDPTLDLSPEWVMRISRLFRTL